MTSTRPSNVSTIFAGGTRHKPDDVKRAQGTYRADRAKDEANYDPVDADLLPCAPDWMVDPRARKYYDETYLIMQKAGILKRADLGILEIYAVERASIQRRYEQMYVVGEDEDGNETFVINPMMAPGTEKLNAFRVLSSELGLTPVSRHKVVAQKPKGEKKDDWKDL